MAENPGVWRLLRGVVERVTAHSAMHEDLMQEALIHLWQREQEYPSQRQAWYLQSCRLHLHNYLRLGRSVDSPKRLDAATPELPQSDDPDEPLDPLDAHGEFLDEVIARDLISALSLWLTPTETQVLGCLAVGLSAREIARRTGFSHTRINQCRRRIAMLAVKFGITPSRWHPR